jgi:hypothetical protein
MTSFLVQPKPGSARTRKQYLFPVEPGWDSEDHAYLRRLVYEEYFRPDERPPTPDASLIAIEGFGAYRPAQFADPNHPLFVEGQAGEGEEAKQLPGTPFTAAQGTVWADFVVPRRLTLEEKRAYERDSKALGTGPSDGLPPPERRARLAAPVNMRLDGTLAEDKALPGAEKEQEGRSLEGSGNAKA